MDRIAASPGFAEAKARSIALLAGLAGRVLDVGCGVGDEVRRLGPRAIGIDASAAMLGVAAGRGGSFVRGDAHDLPFAGRSLVGARTDRVLQHVEHPDGVVAELARVVAPGGRVVALEPDQATLAIDGPDPELTAPIIEFRARRGIRHGFLRLDRLLRRAGFGDVAVERFPTVRLDPADSFGLPTWASQMVERGLLDADRARRFDESLAAAFAAGTFAYRVELVLASATR
jgi:SAM-dependent methyltransferase